MKQMTSMRLPFDGNPTCDSRYCSMECPGCTSYKKTFQARFHQTTLPKECTLSGMDGNANHIIFVISGMLHVQTREIHYFPEAGHFMLLPRQDHLDIKAIQASKIVWLDFMNRVVFCGADCLTALAAVQPEPVQRLVTLPIHPGIQKWLSSLSVMVNTGLDNPCYHTLKEYELFMWLWTEYNKLERAALFGSIMKPHDDFKSFMSCNYDPAFLCADYARLACMSQSTFTRKFRTVFGSSFQQWLVKQKREDLYQAIVAGKRDSKELAQQLGFKNVATLFRFCRNQFDCTLIELSDRLSAHRQEIGRKKTE